MTIFLALIAAFFTACTSQPGTNNSTSANTANSKQAQTDDPPVDHSKMDHSTMDHSAMKSSPDAEKADYDLQFIDTMIAHHQGAIDMAKLVDSRTQRPELKKLASDILTSQQKEIDEMKAWREKWFSGKPAAINMELQGMKESMSMDMTKLATLKDKAFDLDFLKGMIPHHKGAVEMSNEALKRSQRDEIKRLAESIIKAQQLEITSMNEWYKAWVK